MIKHIELTKADMLIEKGVNNLNVEEGIALFFKICGDPDKLEILEALTEKFPLLALGRDALAKIKANFSEICIMKLISLRETMRAGHDEILASKIERFTRDSKARGRSEGREETLTDISLNLFKRQLTIDDVIKITGLSRRKLKMIINRYGVDVKE
jgi:hypothetical protein